MAISDIDVQNRAAEAPLSKQEAVAQALAILNKGSMGHLSSAEIVRRLNMVRDLLQGFKIPRNEREGLDYALMSIPLNQPQTSSEAVDIIRDIFGMILPEDSGLKPKRDSAGRIMPMLNPEIPEPTEEQIAQWEKEYGLAWGEC